MHTATGTSVPTTYGYDPAGQLLFSSPSNGSPTAFTWDQNGNMVGDSWLGNVGTYGWDTENRLLQIVHANGMIETNTYNAHGLRESYTGTGASGRDRFIYDGVNVLLEKLPGGTFAIYTQQPESCGNAPLPSRFNFPLLPRYRVESLKNATPPRRQPRYGRSATV